MTIAEVWAFIDENIAGAEGLLSSSNSVNYVSLDALKALKARVLLYEGKGAQAAALAEGIIKTGKYSLDTFDNIFGGAANKETIFAFGNLGTEGGLYLGSQFYTYNYVNKGGGWFYITDELYNAFEADDMRKTQGIYVESTSPKTIYVLHI